jgi:DNA-binding transcriptional LysR family regulator
MNIPWEDIQLFLAVAEARSMTGAARRLGVAQPTVSRRLAALEAQLREPLFQRSIEGVALTAFGEGLLAPARRVAEWAAEVERVADRADTAPRGVVRVTAPPGIARDFLAPFAAHLRGWLPEVQLEVVATIQYLDLGRREADLALRLQRPAQRDLVTLSALTVEVAAFGSREYMARLPRGYGVADIDWITWAPPFQELAPTPQLRRLIPGFRPVFASDDFLVQLQAAEAGVGAMFLGRARHPFALPTALVEIPLATPLPRSTLFLIASRTALEIPRVRAVADLLVREMKRTDTRAPRSSGRRGQTSR